MEEHRELGLPVPGWTPPPAPGPDQIDGRYVLLERLSADRHAGDLHRGFSADDRIWDYMSIGPFSSAAQYHRWVREHENLDDPVFYAFKDLETGHFGGVGSYLRIAPSAGSIEIGSICLAAGMQRSRAATEALLLMIKWAFEAGYRRVEWKCNALNYGSRRAAQRLGFSFEGVFRQADVVKGHNRDTAWLAAVDKEWPALKEAMEVWLSPSNFDADGRQIERLSDLTALVRINSDPVLGN